MFFLAMTFLSGDCKPLYIALVRDANLTEARVCLP